MVSAASKPAEETFPTSTWRYIIPPAIAAVALMLVALLAAQNLILPHARDHDLLHTAADLELARSIFEYNVRKKPAQEVLQDLQKNELSSLQLFRASARIPAPNPRYISPGSFTECYTTVHDEAGNPSGVLYLRRPAHTSRMVLHTIRAAGAVGLLTFAALLVFTAVTLDRNLLRRLRKLSADFRANVPQKSWVPADEKDAVNILAASAEAVVSHHQRLSESFQSLLDQHGEFFCRLTPDGRILEMNQAFRHFVDEENPDVENFADLVHPAERAAVLQHLAKLHPKDPEIIFEHRGKASPESWLRWQARAEHHEHGSITDYKLFGHDVTGEKKHAAEAAHLQQTLGQVEAFTNAGSLRWNLATGIFQLSPGARRLLAFSPQEHISLDKLIGHVHPDDREAFRRALQTARTTGESFTTTLRPLTAPDRNTTLHCLGEVRNDPLTKLPTDLSCILQTSTSQR